MAPKRPMRDLTAGINLVDTRLARIRVEAYQKRYIDYPVALNYPQLSVESKPISRLLISGNLTYGRSWYSGLDGVLRKGNFDLPLVANVEGHWNVGRGVSATIRYSGASGRPYTPDNMALSLMQNRDVYNLTRINSVRSAAYRRLDFRLEQSRNFYHRTMTWHIGLENALGATNFYSNEWRPRCRKCGVLEQDQMPRFPDGGLRLSF